MSTTQNTNAPANSRRPWNKGKLVGPKPPLQPKHVWAKGIDVEHPCPVADRCVVSAILNGPRRRAMLPCIVSTSPIRPATAESIATIRAAIGAGVTLIDTGDFYGMGQGESPRFLKIDTALNDGLNPETVAPHGLRQLPPEQRFSYQVT